MNKTQKIVASTAIVAGLASIATTANASSHDWSGVANCESSGNWHDTDGYYEGGLQFSNSTWLAYGGGKYAQHAYQATESEQIAIAERDLADHNGNWHSQWPVCGAYLTGGTTPQKPSTGSYSAEQRSSVQKAPEKTYKAPEKTQETLKNGEYTVVSGDTLSGIGQAYDVDWQKIYDANKDIIGSDPNMIYPGQQLHIDADRILEV